MPHADPERRKEYHRNYMRTRYMESATFRKKHKARTHKTTVARRKETRVLVGAFRENGCRLCAEKTPCCLVAHHVDPCTKSFNIGKGVVEYALKRVFHELQKCVCLCANCHAKVHAGIVECPSLENDWKSIYRQIVGNRKKNKRLRLFAKVKKTAGAG